MGHKNCVYCSQGHIMNKYEEMVVETVVIVILTPTPPLLPLPRSSQRPQVTPFHVCTLRAWQSEKVSIQLVLFKYLFLFI